MPVSAASAAASRGQARADACVSAPYAGSPAPLPCTQISPKLPRDARTATSPSSNTASRDPSARRP